MCCWYGRCTSGTEREGVTMPHTVLDPQRPGPANGARQRAPLFEGVFLGGFECSCHRLEDGRRLDLHASTQHDTLATEDYARARSAGMTACRDGISWIASERSSGGFDFSRAATILRAAEASGVEVIWDLMHFGWPDDVDPFTGSFPRRFGRYAAACARFFASATDRAPIITPINEMSYLAWAGGDVRCMNPFEAARGVELKAQLVRATIEAIEAIRDALPGARFLQPEPIIQIHPAPEHPKTWRRVESDNLLQYQAWDMLTGAVWPALGGKPTYLDITGVNFYPDNQFMLDGATIFREDTRYKPLSVMLEEVFVRYGRPMIISETGSEGDHRSAWLRYVCDESIAAMDRGCELHGITLYPVLNHPGWADDRHCENGLWGYADEAGERPVCGALLAEMRAQAPRVAGARAAMLRAHDLLAPVA